MMQQPIRHLKSFMLVRLVLSCLGTFSDDLRHFFSNVFPQILSKYTLTRLKKALKNFNCQPLAHDSRKPVMSIASGRPYLNYPSAFPVTCLNISLAEVRHIIQDKKRIIVHVCSSDQSKGPTDLLLGRMQLGGKVWRGKPHVNLRVCLIGTFSRSVSKAFRYLPSSAASRSLRTCKGRGKGASPKR